jgi:predicted GIY-YIG superfamily endonuclease
MPKWYVCILKSLTRDFIYVGSTNDLERRLFGHNSGWMQWAKAYRPLEIAAYVAVGTDKNAKELEKNFKTGSGKAIPKKRILGEEVPHGTWSSPTDEAPKERSRYRRYSTIAKSISLSSGSTLTTCTRTLSPRR